MMHRSGNSDSQQDEALRAKLEKLLTEAEDCELNSALATDIKKRELFKKLAVDLRPPWRTIFNLSSGT